MSRWKGLLVLMVCFHMAYVIRLSAGVLAVPLGEEFAMTAGDFGLMSSMIFYAYTLMQIPSGILADTVGPRLSVVWGMALAGGGAFLFAAAESLSLLFVGRVLMGVGVSGAFVCTIKYLAENFEGDRFSTLAGINSLVGNWGGLNAQAPLAMMVAFLAWRASFVLLGGVCLTLTLLTLVLVPRDERRPFSLSGLGQSLKSVLAKPGMYPATLSYMASQSCFLALSGTWGVSWLRAVHGLDGAGLMTVMVAGIMVGAPFIGRLSDRWRSRKKPLCLFAVGHTLLWVAAALAPPPLSKITLAALLFGLGFFAGALVVPWTTAKELNSPQHTGLAIAVMNTAAFFAVAVLTSSIGWTLDGGGPLSASESWRGALFLPLGTAAAGLLGAFLTPETFGKQGEEAKILS